MTADNEGQKPATDGIPDLRALTPAMARRAWLRWLADREPFVPDAELARCAAFVTLAINEYELNHGKAAEEVSRKNLAEKIAAFQAAFAAD